MTPYLTSLATIYNYLYGTTICGDAFLHLIGWKWVKRIFLHILSPATIYVFWWQYVLHDLTYIIVGDNLCRTTIYAVTAGLTLFPLAIENDMCPYWKESILQCHNYSLPKFHCITYFLHGAKQCRQILIYIPGIIYMASLMASAVYSTPLQLLFRTFLMI